MEKKELINELKNVKLVIGNGYDLHCGLKSSYNDFFLRDSNKNDSCVKWINEFRKNAHLFIDFSKTNRLSSWIEFDYLNKITVWDIFFYIKTVVRDISNQKNWLWCDIEKVIYDSLVNVNDKKDNSLKWINVFNTIEEGPNACSGNNDVYVIAALILKLRNDKKFINIDEFYDFLLNELKHFENSFGEFIQKQRYSYNNFFNLRNTFFEHNSKLTISKLCNTQNLVAIDSFNFDDVGDDSLSAILHNINGDIFMPIFGVDSSLCEASDPRYIFTKTNRRMELEMMFTECDHDILFDNAIIYGHSLGTTDYSYFFPLLDKLEMLDFSSQKKIIFAFSIYDKDNEYELRKTNRANIQKLFESYAKDKEFKTPNRLLDSLTMYNRVITYEIPTIYFKNKT